MHIMEKPFIDVNAQIDKLINRGLLIESRESARSFLLKTTYYDLINGYKDIFLEVKSDEAEEDKFKPNTNFKDLVDLYELDKKIRHHVLQAVLDIECNFYSALSYCISKKYGEKKEDYLKKENYKAGKIQKRNKKSERENLLWRIDQKIRDADEQPLKYYKEKYGNIPPWILVKALTFGELLVLYKLSSADIKEEVISILVGTIPNEKEKEFFVKSMELFNRFRNRAAHGGRIYNYNTNIELPYYNDIHLLLNISKEQFNLGKGRSDNAAFMLALLACHRNDKIRLLEYIVMLDYDLTKYKENQIPNASNVFDSLGLPFDYFERLKIYINK